MGHCTLASGIGRIEAVCAVARSGRSPPYAAAGLVVDDETFEFACPRTLAMRRWIDADGVRREQILEKDAVVVIRQGDARLLEVSKHGPSTGYGASAREAEPETALDPGATLVVGADTGGVSSAIGGGSAFRWRRFPERDVCVRSDVMHRALPTITKKKRAFADEGMLTTTDCLEIRTFAEAIRDKIAALAPRDMIDVQGFMWSTLSHRAIWFGGFSYRTDGGQTRDMLESFRARDVYAVGCGFEPPIRALVADQIKLKVNERKKGAARIEAAASSSREAEALKAFTEAGRQAGE